MPAPSDEIGLPDLFDIYKRHLRVLLICVVLGLLAGFALSRGPRTYLADSLLRVQLGQESEYRSSPGTPDSVASADQFSPYVDILQSRSLFLKVAKDLDLANNASFLGHPILAHASLDDPKVRSETLAAMRARIAVIHKPKDEIIRLTCTTPVPVLSAKIVNTLINDFVVELVESHFGASKRASGWLEGQLDGLKSEVEQDQVKLTALQAKLGIVGLDEKSSDYLLAQTLGSLTKASSGATVDRIVAEAKYRFLSESDPSLIEGEINLLGGANSSTSANGSLLQSLRGALGVQSSEYAHLLQQFGPNYPEVVQKKAQLDETSRQVKVEQNRILNQAKLSYSAATANEQLTQKELQDTQGKAFGLHNDMVQYVILQHDYESHRNLYESLISRLQEAGITAGLGAGAVDVIDLADVPTLPAPPGRLTYIGGGLLAGFVVGALLTLFLEAINTRVNTAEQARRFSHLPMLTLLPQLKSSIVDLRAHKESSYLDAVETLRSALLGEAAKPQVILLTSTVSGEGKSTISAYLSAVFAQHGQKTLLIDCDLRTNTMAQALQLAGERGLGAYLLGKADLTQVVQTVPLVPFLDVIVSGPPIEERPALLLGSEKFTALLTQVRARYQHVVLNCPPVLGLPDVLNVGPLVDTVVLVVRSKVTRRRNFGLAEQVLDNAHLNVSGYVLNGVSSGSEAYLYHSKDSAASLRKPGVIL